ncbi:MAG: TfoX/Sxy family protein [Burkholderiaceae bacterium]
MAGARDHFVEHCLELFAPLGHARARRMFGGHGLYVDDLFIAIVAADRLYLKVDKDTRAAFEAAGCEPFVYAAKSRSISLGYFTVPDDAVDSPAAMQPWACLAFEAALRAATSRRARPVKVSPPRRLSRPRTRTE